MPCSGFRTVVALLASTRLISLSGSSMSPARMAWVGQTTTHAGSMRFSTRWAQ